MIKMTESLEEDDDKEVINQVVSPTNETSFTSPILPPECWANIFLDIHSIDFHSVINSSPEWNHLLSSRKVVELFEGVLPFVMRFLPKNDFLATRLICRDWKKGVDFVYESHPFRLASLITDLKFIKLARSVRMIPEVDTGIKFQTLESFQRFTNSMNLDSGNPFPGRCVWLRLNLEETEEEDYNSDDEEEDLYNQPINNPEYWSSVTSLLSQFGEHIWYLRLHYIFADANNNPAIEMRLRNILRLVQNLRKLEIALGSNEGVDWSSFNERVISYFTLVPPPKLEKLEVFSFNASESDDQDVHPVILQLLRSYCAEGILKRVDLDICLPYDEPVPLPELVELSTVMDYKALPKLHAASPKLEKLSVHFNYEHGVRHGPRNSDDSDSDAGFIKRRWNDYDSDEDSYDSFDDEVEYHDCNISTIFDGLHLFSDTLKELHIDDNAISCNKLKEDYTVQLPKLERLFFKFSLPVRHLFELTSLKYLQIDGSSGFQNRAYGTELFEQLPKLGKVVHSMNGRSTVMFRPILYKCYQIGDLNRLKIVKVK